LLPRIATLEISPRLHMCQPRRARDGKEGFEPVDDVIAAASNLVLAVKFRASAEA
jgi:hypothetical protein